MSFIPYPVLRGLLFRIEAERAHYLSLEAMRWAERLRLSGLYRHSELPDVPVQAMGLNFRNPVGLAAGLDKNGDYIDALGDLGFGFLEIGTITPRPQQGNSKPRLFRLQEHEAIINRMGFNNKGVDYLVERVKKRNYKGILGINIGKNFDTSIETADRDYLIGMEKVYAYADYITVNISSPNTPGLRSLQTGDLLNRLVSLLVEKQYSLERMHGKRVPLLLKVAPDIDEPDISNLAKTALRYGVSGIIATNTTISRHEISESPLAQESGGLSGRPLFKRSTQTLSSLSGLLGRGITLVGVGGIDSAETAAAKFAAGATLVQLYTGFIYHGPDLIEDICTHQARGNR